MSTSVNSAGTPVILHTRSAISPSSKSNAIVAPIRPLTGKPPGNYRRSEARDVEVQLQYLADDPLYKTTKPLQITPNFADKEGRTNVRLSPGKKETIRDVRGREHEFSLDTNGFRYVKAPTKFKDWDSQRKIGEIHLPELEALLRREVDGVDEILFYDMRIRQAGEKGVRVAGLSHNPFARQVHVDNTESSCITKIRDLTEMKADFLLRGRARIINIWRPIKHPVYDCGLAIADGGKLQEGDVLECDRHRHDTGKFWDTMGVIQYRPGFEWYYMSEQDEEDCLLFKNWDSARDVPARHCLHTAFDLPADTIPPGAPTRESIEVRALVFTHPRDQRRMSAGTLLQQATTIPHPLAETLKREELRYVDDELYITDRLRKDIDEAYEVKDAVLLLRKKEIKALERVRDSLVEERSQLGEELALARKQIEIHEAHAHALETEVAHLKNKLQSSDPQNLHQQIRALSAQLADARINEHTRPRPVPDGARPPEQTSWTETELLRQHIEHQDRLIAKWKLEAEGRANDAVSRVWQASVDGAVEAQRRKDAFVIASLHEENARLKWEAARKDSVAGNAVDMDHESASIS